MSPTYFTFAAGAVKSLFTRFSTLAFAASGTVVRTPRRSRRPGRWWVRMTRATRLWFTLSCSVTPSLSSAVTRGAP